VSIVETKRAGASRAAMVLIAILGVIGSILAPTAPQTAVAASAEASSLSSTQEPASAPVTALPQPQSAVSGSDFQDGYIISDQNFFDYNSMDAGAVQAFLNARVARCVGANGQPCLKDYSTTAAAIGGDTLCQGMPGGAMSAAQIIVAAARSCRISPKVLLVMLQKEQGLVTSTSPSEWNYRAALGQSCPDTAPCDSAFSGFYRQVYYGARQLQAYMRYPGSYAYRVGWNNILYHPNTGCGTKPVYIQNDATRLLYIYTPYTPNTAALNNLYGTGDGCSSYGNRNFWRFYSDWFGSPIAPVSPEINALYAALGGSGSWLGTPMTNVLCSAAEGWCYQWFVNGLILWTSETGAQTMSRPMHQVWVAQGNEKGWMGYPMTSPICSPAEGWCYQWFQGGIIMQTDPTGAQPMTRAVHSVWAAQGNGSGPLGYPTSSAICTADVCTQSFQGGGITTTPNATYTSSGSIFATWATQGGPGGWLGAPMTSTISNAAEGWSYQWFVNGVIMYTAATGAQPMSRPIHAAWAAQGNGSGPLGYPTSIIACDADVSCSQNFQAGAIVSHPISGTSISNSAILATWRAQGGRSGPMGYPSANAVCAADGSCTQNFQRGMIVSSPTTGAYLTTPEVQATWTAQGGNNGWLGAPLTPTISNASEGWTYQWFQNGLIMYTAATGAQAMSRSIHSVWSAQGNGSGPLGYPTTSVTCDAGNICTQEFQGGMVVSSPTSGAYVTTPEMVTTWRAQGGNSGWLGAPLTQAFSSTAEGWTYQWFQNGLIMYTAATGAQAMSRTTHATWSAQGNGSGPLGYPTTSVTCEPANSCSQNFQGGVLISNGTVAYTTTAEVLTAWKAQGGANGWMGAPLTQAFSSTAEGWTYQWFQNGLIMYTAATGAQAMSRTTHATWSAQGNGSGPLGYPTTSVTSDGAGGTMQTFQSGVIRVSAGGATTIQ
jgi:uncharacterized protein with LGFP repeats